MKRAIAAMPMDGVTPGAPATRPPVFMTVAPAELLVDASYQRDLSDASVRLIRRIVAEWDWRKFKAPTVAMTDEGPVVLDGQHTATAAASHPLITEIPVLLVDAIEQQDQAKAYVGLNTNRLGMTAAQIHAANVVAGDATAMAVERVCAAAGIRVLRLPPSHAVYKPGETIAVAAIGGLVARKGEERATRILSILAGVGFGPVSAHHMRAVEQLLTDPEFADIDSDDLARVIQTLGIDASEKEAKAFAATHCVPFYRGLAAVWLKGRKARRKPEPQGLRENPTTDEKATAGQRDTAAELRAHLEFGIARDSTPRKLPVSEPKSERDQAPARAIRPPAIPKEIITAGEPKKDTSEAIGEWAPGPFQRRCRSCEELFIGAKDARKCAECAYAHEGTS